MVQVRQLGDRDIRGWFPEDHSPMCASGLVPKKTMSQPGIPVLPDKTFAPLSQTNPFLKDPEERRFWLFTTVTSSAAIEGVHLSQRRPSKKHKKERGRR